MSELNALPASVELLKSLHLTSALLALVPVNLALGWPVLTLFAEGIGSGAGDTSLRRLATWLARRTAGVVSLALVLAFPSYILGVVIYGEAWLPAAQQTGWLFLAVVPLLFLGLGGAFWVALRRRGTEPSTMRPFLPDVVESYILAFRRRGVERPGMTLTAISALALAGIGFTLTTHSVVLENPQMWGAGAADPSGLLLPLRSPQWLPRLMHMLLGALAISGFAVAWHGADRMAAGEPGYGHTALRFGALWFMVSTGLQLLAGVWFVFSLRPNVPATFAGSAVPFAALLWVGAGSALICVVLVGIALASREPRTVIRTAAAFLALTAGAMLAARHHVRAAVLDEILDLAARPVALSPEMMTFFWVVAGLAAVILGYMVAIAPRSPGREQ